MGIASYYACCDCYVISLSTVHLIMYRGKALLCNKKYVSLIVT